MSEGGASAGKAGHVVVIGYGYAGAMAAIAAADAGARVTLVEKAATPGGISVCSAGGLRIAQDAGRASAYLRATNGGKTPDDVLETLAQGMTGLAPRLRALADGLGARIETRQSPGNYPFEGHETFGFAYVEALADATAEALYPHVRGNPQGALLFAVLERNVARRTGITVRLNTPAERLVTEHGRVTGVKLASGEALHGAVVLAAGGFEGDAQMQAQYWPGGAMLNAAYAGNTGDGIRMAQAVGADLWHMWHAHACYGFEVPGHAYGVRVKRLPDWLPGPDGLPGHEVPPVAWILLDGHGRRFMNEYEPYLQDTGARALAEMDVARQTMPRNPAWFVTDADGLTLYPMGKPTWNDASAGYEWSDDNSAEVASGVFRRAGSVAELAQIIGAQASAVAATLSAWSGACTARHDPLGRPPSSMRDLAPPYFAASVVPVVSNTQGGPRHDAAQRVLDPFGAPIPGLWAAGECGSVFGHLYLSGGNIAECFVGGEIAGRTAALAAAQETEVS